MKIQIVSHGKGDFSRVMNSIGSKTAVFVVCFRTEFFYLALTGLKITL